MLIRGPATASKATVEANLAQLGPHPRFAGEMLPALWVAAHVCGIDPVVQVAQAGHETGWGHYGGVVGPEWKNTAGIKTRQGGSDTDPEAHQRFPSWTVGALAHALHLLAYCQVDPPPGVLNVDPRWQWVRGRRPAISTVEELDAWATHAGYGALVAATARKLTQGGTTVAYADGGWLPGWRHLPRAAPKDGQYYQPGYPARVTWHTIEGWLTEGMTLSHPAPPQLWASPRTRLKVQSIPLIWGGFATYYQSGYPYDPDTVTNHVQIEVEGFAGQTGTWPREWLDWLADEVLVPIMRFYAENGIPFDPLQTPDTANEHMGGSAADDAPQRFSWGEWAGHNGTGGHRHIPGNGDRWDPGPLDTLYIARRAAAVLGGGVTPGPVIPPKPKRYGRNEMDHAKYRMDPKDPAKRFVFNEPVLGRCWCLDFPVVLPGGHIYHQPLHEGQRHLIGLYFHSHRDKNASWWDHAGLQLGTFAIPAGLPPGRATVLVPEGVEYEATYVSPLVQAA